MTAPAIVFAYNRLEQTRKTLEESGMPEVQYFLKHFIPAFELTLDELGTIRE